MTNPKEEAIALLIAQLKKIKRANGYASDLAAVFRIDLEQDQIFETKLPCLLVLDDPAGEDFEFQDGQLYHSRLPLMIGGIVSVAEEDLTAGERVVVLNWLLRDTITAFIQDSTFGNRNKVKDSALHRAVTAVDTDRGFGYFALYVHLTYYFSYASLVA